MRHLRWGLPQRILSLLAITICSGCAPLQPQLPASLEEEAYGSVGCAGEGQLLIEEYLPVGSIDLAHPGVNQYELPVDTWVPTDIAILLSARTGPHWVTDQHLPLEASVIVELRKGQIIQTNKNAPLSTWGQWVWGQAKDNRCLLLPFSRLHSSYTSDFLESNHQILTVIVSEGDSRAEQFHCQVALRRTLN
jgi:hypothetical protein